MRHILTLFLILPIFIFSGCAENDKDPNAIPDKYYSKTHKSYSSDQSKLLTLKEHGMLGERGYTQVFIEFINNGTGSHVYSADTTGVDIKTYWLDDHKTIL